MVDNDSLALVAMNSALHENPLTFTSHSILHFAGDTRNGPMKLDIVTRTFMKRSRITGFSLHTLAKEFINTHLLPILHGTGYV